MNSLKISLFTLLIVFLVFSPIPVKATTSFPIEEILDPVTTIIKDIATGILRFILFLGGILFLVAVVVGAFRGSIGSALGNRMQVSQGLFAAMSAVGALILLLLSVPLANLLIDRVSGVLVDGISSEQIVSITDQIPTDNTVQDLDLNQFLEIPELQKTITDLAVTLIRFLITTGLIVFVIAVALGALDTQLSTVLGGVSNASSGVNRIISAVTAVILLLISYPLADSILRTLIPRLLTGVSIQLPEF